MTALARGAWRGLRFAALVGRWFLESRSLNNLDAGARAHWRQLQCRRAMHVLNIHVTVIGPPPTSGLLVANHLGYVDVFTLGSLVPATFVSKAEVERWPLLGAIATRAGTLYVQRDSVRSAAYVGRKIASLLSAGEPVIVFPEGTSSGGERVLPFQPPLFDTALRSGSPVHTAAVHYTVPLREGNAAEDVAYWGDMTLASHLFGLLCISRIDCTVQFGGVSIEGTHRRELAEAAHASVVALSMSTDKAEPARCVCAK